MRAYLLLQLGAALLLLPSVSQAQSPLSKPAFNERRSSKVPERVVLLATRQLRIPQDSKFYPIYKRAIEKRWKEDYQIDLEEKRIEGLNEKQKKEARLAFMKEYSKESEITPLSRAEIEFEKPPVNATKHIRSDKGAPFTTKETIDQVWRPSIKSALDKVHEKVEKATAKAAKHDGLAAPKLPACDGNITRERKTSSKLKASAEDGPIFDMLFIPFESKPRDPDEYFGLKTRIRYYKAGAQDYQSLAAYSLGVRCLPTRIRGYKGVRYRHEGLDALKNYDQNPQGEMHTAVADTISRYLP